MPKIDKSKKFLGRVFTDFSIRVAQYFRVSVLCAVVASVFVTSMAGAHRVSITAVGDRSDVELYQSVLDLGSPWTVMCVAAHPDDEDGASLTVLRRKYGVHTVSLFSTYGEGGQNAIGPELYEELGAIRARETQEAAEIQGSEPYFLGLRDFGFSKSAEEAFHIWGHDEALRRMVLKIRELRPDVIITNHDTVSGHGHHQATGRLVLEAFDAAADPTRFPDQLRNNHVGVWQAQRLFVRVSYEGGSGSKPLEDAAQKSGSIILIDPNERDPVRGSTYAEQALLALHHHATQGPWPQTLGSSGAPKIRYRLAREAKGAGPFLLKSEPFLGGLRLPDATAQVLQPPKIDGRSLTEYTSQKDQVFNAVTAWRKEHRIGFLLDSLNEPHLDLINRRTHHALAAAAGIRASLDPIHKPAVANAAETLALSITNAGDGPAKLKEAYLNGWEKQQQIAVPAEVNPKTSIQVTRSIEAPSDSEINVPHSAHLYDGRLPGSLVSGWIGLEVRGETFSIPVSSHIDIAPAVGIVIITPTPLVLTPETYGRPLNFVVRLTNNQIRQFKGKLVYGFNSQTTGEQNETIKLAPGEIRDVAATMAPIKRMDRGNISMEPQIITFKVLNEGGGKPLSAIDGRVVYSNALVHPRLRVAYLRSTDYTVGRALDALGLESKELTIGDVRQSNLHQYNTIIIDNRGYQIHPELVGLNARLLDYARAGGTLIVFYHKANEWNPDPGKNRSQLAPYPIILGTDRVTDETSPVLFADSQSALLQLPNRITQDDFKDWVQERGLYYPKEWDSHYAAPLATGDPGEHTLRGGLLAGKYGKGAYIYTSMVWYRQLRAGVPGAYRIFANMISYGQKGSPGTSN